MKIISSKLRGHSLQHTDHSLSCFPKLHHIRSIDMRTLKRKQKNYKHFEEKHGILFTQNQKFFRKRRTKPQVFRLLSTHVKMKRRRLQNYVNIGGKTSTQSAAPDYISSTNMAPKHLRTHGKRPPSPQDISEKAWCRQV